MSKDIYTKREISHDEAIGVARRLVNSFFKREPRARVSIPARPDYDDDLLIRAYIDQQNRREQEANAKLAVAVEATEKCAKQFRFYEQQHMDKGTLDGDAKARTNAQFAEMCEATLSTLPAQAAQMLALIEAAREFRDNGTVLTSCSRGSCQRVIEHEDRSDPQAKLFKALHDFDANR